LALFVQDAQGEKRVEQTVYGEAQGSANNHRGKVYQVFDGAGVVTSQNYDFKGNLLGGTRQLLQNYQERVDWSQNPALEPQIFASSTVYDALNRPITLTTPDNSTIRPLYNEANLLNAVAVNLRGAATATPFIQNIDYDAKGQRQLIRYGNDVVTTYEYDDKTFRLIHLRTDRGNPFPADRPGGIQNLFYTYDPVGNITEIRDDAQQTIFYNGEVVSPRNEYVYNALYQLIRAEGREHIGQVADPQPEYNSSDFPRVNLPHPNDGNAMRDYIELYEYDSVGNILRMIHQADKGDWIRRYDYETTNNRLRNTSLPGDPVDLSSGSPRYLYDEHGSMTKIPHLLQMDWDFKDELQRVDLGGGGVAYYVYDAAGQRVRKVIERQTGTRQKERIYLGGLEIYREYSGDGSAVTLERETLHVMDDRQRIALVETKTIELGDGINSPTNLITPILRYQLSNHLGSASLEVDGTGNLISYEEYHPYGTTAYHATDNRIEVSQKRYRYTGKERDEETGLAYHGARYYAAWLGRWTSADPFGLLDGTNRYAYARNRPTVAVDPQGTESFNAGEPLGYETIDGVEYARYQAREGTWISASMRAMGWGEVFAKEQGYGAYTGMVRDASGAIYRSPDKVEIGDQYLIPTMHQVFEYPEATVTGTVPPAEWSLTDLLPDAVGINIDFTVSSGAAMLGGLEVNFTPHGITYTIPLKGPYWGQSVVLPYAGGGGSVTLGQSLSPESQQVNLNPQVFYFSGDNADITPESKAGCSVGGSVGGELAVGLLGEAKGTASLDAPSDAGIWGSFGMSVGFGAGVTEAAELEAGVNVTYSQIVGQYEPTADMSWSDFLVWSRMRAAWNLGFGGLSRNTVVNNPITRGEVPLYTSPTGQ
jgi:RHS repeat-associated protein